LDHGDCVIDGTASTACSWPSDVVSNSPDGAVIQLRSESSTTGVNAVTAGNALVTRTDGTTESTATTIASDGSLQVSVSNPSTATSVEVTLGTEGVGSGTDGAGYSARGLTLRDPKVTTVQGTQMGNNISDPTASDYMPPACRFDELAAPTGTVTAAATGYVVREIARDDTNCTELVETGVAPGTGTYVQPRSTTGSRTLTAYGRLEDFANIDLAAVKTKLTWAWNTRTNSITSFAGSDGRSHFVPTGWSDWKNHHLTVSRPATNEAYAGTFAQFTGGRPLCSGVPIEFTFYGNYVDGFVGGRAQTGSPHAAINPPLCYKLLHWSFDVLS
jgi:hypothetical protein